MTITLNARAEAHRAVDLAMEAAQDAEAALVRATLTALCLDVRASIIDAVTIDLIWSDQGPWLDLGTITTASGDALVYYDDMNLAANLQETFSNVWGDYVGEVGNVSRTGYYRATIDAVLSAVADDEAAA